MNKLAVAFEKSWKTALVIGLIGAGFIAHLGTLFYDALSSKKEK